LPALLAVTKADEATPYGLARVARAVPDLEVITVSVLDDDSLDSFRAAVWRLTGLIRVFLRRPGEDDAEPVALRPPATVLDAADEIHHELAAACRGARIWGRSARFDGQRVGRAHPLADGDVVEIVA
jgi:ribosome-interacting GTPase 1